MSAETIRDSGRTYGSYADFYRLSGYAAFPQQHRTVSGSRQSGMIMVDQGRHEFSDPVIDELVISTPLAAAPCSYDWNMGSGWSGGRSQTGDLIVVPPNVDSRWRVGGPRRLAILAVPSALIRELLGPDCPRNLSTAFEPIAGSSAHDPFVGASLDRLWSLGAADEPMNRMLADSTVLALVCQLLVLAKAAAPTPGPAALSAREWKRLCAYVDAHLHQDMELVDLAEETGWSVRHFSRMFRQSTGQTPHKWILRKRVDRAKELLRTRKLPLAEIALTCGFADQSHFTTSFRKMTGATPLRWQREMA